MKKFFGIAAILYALLAVGSGLSLQPMQLRDLNSDDGSQASDLGAYQKEVDTRIWHPVTTFEADNQANQLTQTGTFYIPGDVFRISYIIVAEPSEQPNPEYISNNGSAFFLIEAKQLVDEGDLLASRCEEDNRPQVIGSFEVGATSGYYYLNIWSINCSQWEVMVESLH
ncbi:hypothetical protein ACFLXN_00795 [Chloroflexota bacterium]